MSLARAIARAGRPAFAFLLATLLVGARAPDTPGWARFGPPEAVAMIGYDGDIMEPFLSRDGRILIFNNRNDPPERTELHWAERVDDLTFRYRGPVDGANSPALDGVGTLSAQGRFCFVSTRDYATTLNTIFCGTWRDGRVTGLAAQPLVSLHIPGRMEFDTELAADGQTLIIVDGLFRGGAVPAQADFRQARWRDGAFRLEPADDALFARINTPGLEYAAGLSADGLRLVFTRLTGHFPFYRTTQWLSRRETVDAPWGEPVRIVSVGGFAEAGTWTPDGRALYFHRRTGNRFTLIRVAREG